jgi:hypothetical protein
MFRLRVKDARRHPQFHPIVNSHCALVNHLTSVEPNRYKVYFEDLGYFPGYGPFRGTPDTAGACIEEAGPD